MCLSNPELKRWLEQDAKRVSVPLRGCVCQISLGTCLTFPNPCCFRPLAGMCLSNREKKMTYTLENFSVSVPLRGCVCQMELWNNGRARPRGCFRPLAGMCLSNFFGELSLKVFRDCFRPLAGMCLSNHSEVSECDRGHQGFPSPCGDVFVKSRCARATHSGILRRFPSPCGDVFVKY